MTSIILLVAAVGGVVLGGTVPPASGPRPARGKTAVSGPGIAAYLVVAVALFSIGAFGVLIRRSPLIVLLALEIMLNAGNLALLAFARQMGGEDGQIFALAVMVVAAVGGGRRARPHRGDVAPARRPRRRQADHAARMTYARLGLALLARGRGRRDRPRRTAHHRAQAGWIATGATFVSFVASVVVLVQLWRREPEERSELSTIWTWLSAGDFNAGFEVVIDPLSVFMMLVVSGVGFLILTYAIGYMAERPEERRYHAYKALFIFSMLLLVQAGNLLLLLAGWGMVGLSSYLLINFWHQRASAVAAGKKAFIMNAVGDATFALALFILIQQTGSVDFGVVFSRRPRRSARRRRSPRSSRSASWAAPLPSRRRSRCTPGSRTRWRARRRSAPSSTRRRW